MVGHKKCGNNAVEISVFLLHQLMYINRIDSANICIILYYYSSAMHWKDPFLVNLCLNVPAPVHFLKVQFDFMMVALLLRR